MSVTKDAGFPVTTFSTADGTANLAWTAFTTPGTNRFLVAILMGDGAAANALIAMTSPNLTWTPRVSVVDAGNNHRVEIWTAFAASVVTSEVITSGHNTSGVSYGRRSAIVCSLDGSDASGFGNSASNIAGGGATPSLAITATAAGSYLVAGFPYRSSGSDIGIDASTTSEYDQGGGGGFGFNERAGSRASASAGSLTLLWTGTPFSWETIGGIEVLATGGGGGGTAVPVFYTHRTQQGLS